MCLSRTSFHEADTTTCAVCRFVPAGEGETTVSVSVKEEEEEEEEWDG